MNYRPDTLRVESLIESAHEPTNERIDRMVKATMERIHQTEAFRRNSLDAANSEAWKQRRLAEKYHSLFVDSVIVLGIVTVIAIGLGLELLRRS